jgi:hypothetical protein
MVSPAESKHMSYRVFWIVEHHVLYIRLSGHIGLDDFHDSSKHIADLMDEAYAKDTANIIIGVIDLRDASLGMLVRSAITASAQTIADVIDPRVWKARPGFTILITTSDAARMLTSIIIRLTTQPMTTVGTLAEALMVVSYMYPELQTQLTAYTDDPRSAENTN